MVKSAFFIILLYCCCRSSHFAAATSGWPEKAKAAFEEADGQMKYMLNHITTVSRQVMLQQFFSEQRVRSEGQSGVKTIRLRGGGTKNYFTTSHTGHSSLGIHDHANNVRTVGMGEFIGVLNGVEFQTRHNDYRLFMPHRTSKEYNAVEPVPLPDVPPEVLNQTTVDKQIQEMREWFKAWRDQNHTVRDYRRYFKPVLCYLEGGWTNSGSKVDEPFASDRHFIDAASWQELHQKVRFTAYTGSKSINENLAFLPTKIMRLINDTIPEFAQWNYRVLCHPVKRDIPLNRLRVVEDLSSRMMTGFNIHRYLHSRSARFHFNSKDEDEFYDRPLERGLLDDIMEEIPGKENYQGNLTDEGLDTAALNFDKTVKDVSRYHRWLSIAGRDAMGTQNQHRGYNDDYLFAAMTTQPKISPIEITKCKNKYNKATCGTVSQRWTYAVPLELIYLTPLHRWNPYNIQYRGEHRIHAKTVHSNGRNGNCAEDGKKAYNGTTSSLYYVTPNEFYSGNYVGATPADTVRYSTCILDKSGESRQVRPAGVHVFLPSIKDVGVMRTRYPVYPVHGEGSSVWKELNALRDIVINGDKWKHMLWTEKDVDASNTDIVVAVMSQSRSDKTTPHIHDIELSTEELSQLKGGRRITKTTSVENGHQHELVLRYNQNNMKFYYDRCGGKWQCWDKHPRDIEIKVTNAEDAL